jgi:hypothetical protein
MIRTTLAAALVAMASATPAAAIASCEPGGAPDAGDITAVFAQHHGFPVSREPEFRLSVSGSPHYDAKLRRMTTELKVQLTALGLRPVPRGVYALDGDPAALLSTLASTIERADFFTLRFTPTDRMYLEGPSDSVAVVRCGVRTIVSTIPEPFEWLNLCDANARRFFALIDRIGEIVSAQRWTRLPDPSPSPSPSP